MVTRSVIRISPEEKAALDANANKHHENDRLLEDERKSLDDANNDEDIDPINFSEVYAGNLDCDGPLSLLPPTLPPLPPLDAEVAQGTSMEITQQDNDTNKKRRRDAQNERNKKRRKKIDLSEVPEQPLIRNKRKGGSSKFRGVTFNKARKKWVASIQIDGKQSFIGQYDTEEEAAIDYARASLKYRGGSKQQGTMIDLTDVPKQLPIKIVRKGSSSQYKGVNFNKARKKWRAVIKIGGKLHNIGYYSEEEEAGIDYARAVFKYIGVRALLKYRAVGEDNDWQAKKSINLTDVPKQPPIKSEKKGSGSQYKGVTFHKRQKKWLASIYIDGKQRYIGCYDNEEEAAVDYARAVVKYKGSNTEDGNGQKKKISIDLTDVPAQQAIKSEKKSSSSQYKGVYLNTAKKKWVATLYIGDKKYIIGYYDNEEEAAVDYARAVFKYKGANNDGDSRQRKEV